MSGRLEGAIESVDAATAASHVDTDAVVAVSGFGAVGYPKALPLALADDDRELTAKRTAATSHAIPSRRFLAVLSRCRPSPIVSTTIGGHSDRNYSYSRARRSNSRTFPDGEIILNNRS